MDRRLSRWSFVALLGCCSLTAFAGGSSSGGGELLEDDFNPWFLDGAQNVTYCVARASDFSVSNEVLENLVSEAFTYWNGEFSNAYLPDNLYGADPAHPLRVHVMTTGFIQKDCSEQVDLAFQFGTLTDAQTVYINDQSIDTRRYVAFTGRQDYDRVNLRGKGFIYVSPDRGPNAFVGENIVANAWTIDSYSRLGKVIMHELGHVLGLPHIGGPGELMGQDFPETVVSETVPLDTVFSPLPVFYPREGSKYSSCLDYVAPLAQLYGFFGLKPVTQCVSISFDLDNLRVQTRPDDAAPWVEVGRATFADPGQRRYQRLVAVWLPKEQGIFPPAATEIKTLLGPALVQLQISGVYASVDGSITRSLFVQSDPRYFQIGGVLDGVMVPDVIGGQVQIPMLPFSLSGWVPGSFNEALRSRIHNTRGGKP